MNLFANNRKRKMLRLLWYLPFFTPYRRKLTSYLKSIYTFHRIEYTKLS